MTWPSLPDPPEVAADQIGRGSTRPRYEDVAQDGRVRMEGIWPAIGPILWGGGMPIARPFGRLGARGIRAVLTRAVLWGGPDPISVHNRTEHELRYELARAGERLLFDTWLETHAPHRDGGREVLVARAYGQHVFTKPAAPPGEHRVTELDDPELPRVPRREHVFLEALDLLALPDGAEPLEAELTPDAAVVAFGLAHTDGNQHVNFLAYPRLVEDAALRRMACLGFGSRMLARFAEVGYKKPCFAGDSMQVLMRAFRHPEGFGVVAAFSPEPNARPHVTVRLLLSQ